MKLLLFLLVSFILTTSSLNVRADDDNSNTTTTTTTTIVPAFTSTTTVAPDPEKYDYILKMQYIIDNNKVPEFVDYIIDNQMVQYQLTLSDLIAFFHINENGLDATMDLLENLGFQVEDVFNIFTLEDALKLVNQDFTQFYRSLLKNLEHIINMATFVESFDINKMELAGANAYEPSKMSGIIKAGNYTLPNLDAALQTTLSRNEFFAIIRNILIEYAKLLNSNESNKVYTTIKNKLKSGAIKTIYDPTVEEIYSIPKFKTIFEDIEKDLSHHEDFAVATDKNIVIINKKIYEHWVKDSKLLEIQGQSVVDNAITYELMEYEGANVSNIIQLKSTNHTVSHIKMGHDKTDLDDCVYVSYKNNNLTIAPCAGSIDGQTISIPRNLTTKFTLGGPLICDKKLYGLAREETEKHILFDAVFTNKKSDDFSASATIQLTKCLFLLSLFVIYYVFW